mmetsp:Transcript_140519/g.244618  ORF Transcript_140519/g.244618 Transcript_140519/m.244618 type:complete len:661 (-) Transcript_140519:806-2788(-)
MENKQPKSTELAAVVSIPDMETGNQALPGVPEHHVVDMGAISGAGAGGAKQRAKSPLLQVKDQVQNQPRPRSPSMEKEEEEDAEEEVVAPLGDEADHFEDHTGSYFTRLRIISFFISAAIAVFIVLVGTKTIPLGTEARPPALIFVLVLFAGHGFALIPVLILHALVRLLQRLGVGAEVLDFTLMSSTWLFRISWMSLSLVFWHVADDVTEVTNSGNGTDGVNYYRSVLVALVVSAAVLGVKSIVFAFYKDWLQIQQFAPALMKDIVQEWILWCLCPPARLKPENGVVPISKARCHYFIQKLQEAERAETELLLLGDKELNKKLRFVSAYITSNRLPMPMTETFINSRADATQAATQIFSHLVENKRLLFAEKIEAIIGKDACAFFFSRFDINHDGHLSMNEFRSAITTLYLDRRNLARTLQDTSNILIAVNALATVVSTLVLGFLWLILLQVDVGQVLVPASTLLVAYAFVFGNSVRAFFDGIIFILVVHSYDVGDDISVLLNGTWHKLKVKSIHLLYTRFQLWDGAEYYIPNANLSTNALINHRRSAAMHEEISFLISMGTTHKQIQALETAIVKYVNSKRHDWHPDPTFKCIDITPNGMIKCCLWVKGTTNWYYGNRWKRKNDLVLRIQQACVQQEIVFSPPQTNLGGALEVKKHCE